jgi:type IV pilus assembly protein PilA
MGPTLRTRTQLELLTKLREKKNPLQKGFTLVELMIVVAVVGILSAVALPNFLNARSAADAGAKVGTVLGLAKECASLAVSDIGDAPFGGTDVTVSCNNSGGNVVGAFQSGASGVRCLDKTSTSGASKVNASITNSGSISCTFT